METIPQLKDMNILSMQINHDLVPNLELMLISYELFILQHQPMIKPTSHNGKNLH